MKVFYSSEKINPNFYMELGVDEGHPVLYVTKEGKLFDWHFSEGSSFSAEMKNTIDCFKTVHGLDPRLKDIACWRTWFKVLKDRNAIS